MNTGQKISITAGAFVITFVSICAIFRSDIMYLLTSKKIERKYGTEYVNNYYIEDNFEYIDNYDKPDINTKQDLINSIYYTINSGIKYTEKYCTKDYTTCYNDINEISQNTELLSNLNNFVHPYNSFENITFEFNGNVIKIKLDSIYTNEEIKELNKILDGFIEKYIDDKMSTKEKIKTIHDYIINTTEYDTEYNPDATYNKHKANTAYGVLVEGYGICSGYSDAMALFLDKLNIINYKISNDEHIWNLVYLDNTWLHLDLTWDDPISDKNITRDNYFLITDKTLQLLNDDEHYYNKNIFREATK